MSWTCPIINSGKDSITIKIENKEGKSEQKIISKNDSIDVEMEADVHQEVKIKILIKN